jgi:hypothetical protein
VFAFREEFLPEFESKTVKIPSLKSSRFRLMPMNGNQAFDVITKTWKNNIDEKEAYKIISFFVNTEDQNKSYELMEIEPSLLSQVCTYIDKERINEGRSKISSDFLERYPKERILHSIYNEVLNESNIAVLGTNPDLTKNPKPVNEFLEDKLITDEGYRTKYSLSEIDRALLPGIDVLKRKYFVRDDGKSVEITHDVLAPIIKDDREARRKAIAVAAAKKRANRRALIIILLALAAGFLFWYFATKKAFADEQAAIARKDSIGKQITSDSTSLAVINDSIVKARKNLARYGGHVNYIPGDSAYLEMMQQNENDSIHLAFMQNQFENLKNQKSELQNNIDLQNARINDLLNTDALQSAEAKRSIQYLKQRVTFDSTKLSDLQKAYADLSRQFYDYKIKHPEMFSPEGRKQEIDAADTNSLKLNLHYELSKAIPHNLLIYLIPDNSSNKKVIRKSEIYEIGCDVNLSRVKDKKIAAYKNGLYVFYDVAPGTYFIKACSYYGGFETYTKKSRGNVTINFNASPPIR